jgi:hypothetical protein
MGYAGLGGRSDRRLGSSRKSSIADFLLDEQQTFIEVAPGGHSCLGFFRAGNVERAEFYLNWQGPPLTPNGVIKGSASN